MEAIGQIYLVFSFMTFVPENANSTTCRSAVLNVWEEMGGRAMNQRSFFCVWQCTLIHSSLQGWEGNE